MASETFKARIARVRREAVDIVSVDLAPLDDRPLPAFTPGAHIDLHLPGNLVRQYSLYNGPEETGVYRIAVKREAQSRGGSVAVHEQLRPGDTVTLAGPRNNFPLAADATRHLLLAGGIGITPLVSMARHLRAEGDPFELQYFTRTPEHTAFRELLSGSGLSERVSFHHGYDAQRLRQHLETTIGRYDPGTHLYICGPGPFMELAQEVAAAAWPREAIHLEHFSPPALVAEGEHAFEVRLARRGVSFLVPPDKTITQVFAEHGLTPYVSCEMGICGTCVTRVLEGEPDHRDEFLTEPEKRAGRFTPCVSRAKGARLVLDM